MQELLPIDNVTRATNNNLTNSLLITPCLHSNELVLTDNSATMFSKKATDLTSGYFSKLTREVGFSPEYVDNNTLKTNLTELMFTKTAYKNLNLLNKAVDERKFYNYKTFTLHEESTRDVKNNMGKANPLTLVKIPVNKVNELTDSAFLFKFRYNDKNAILSNKTMTKIPYFAFKQQRYKARKLIPMTTKKYIDDLGNEKTVKNHFTLNNQYSIETDIQNPGRYYRMLRKNRVRSENMPVVVSKRLLRVKKTLVLPTHINITAVTNSYDVVHSWFIPGLGLKMDCVPGRSTHHTFYIDNAGFYYGQCAEICGRYHHHMPIRVCALPFEHFLVWWHSFGLPKLMYPGKKYKEMRMYSFRKFA